MTLSAVYTSRLLSRIFILMTRSASFSTCSARELSRFVSLEKKRIYPLSISANLMLRSLNVLTRKRNNAFVPHDSTLDDKTLFLMFIPVQFPPRTQTWIMRESTLTSDRNILSRLIQTYKLKLNSASYSNRPVFSKIDNRDLNRVPGDEVCIQITKWTPDIWFMEHYGWVTD